MFPPLSGGTFSRRLAGSGGLGRERLFGGVAAVVTMDAEDDAETATLHHPPRYGAEVFHFLDEMSLGGDCA